MTSAERRAEAAALAIAPDDARPPRWSVIRDVLGWVRRIAEVGER
jgi:hypothetical protein